MPRSIPISATYRLQFNKNFTFQDAAKLVGYLSELGITHIYASPVLRARRDSSHGYDVIDSTRLNPELGAEADFNFLNEELKRRSMGLILDIVPNHMSASSENAWWMDVLENGRDSAYASHFDINWHPPSRGLEGKILLPVLGRPFAEVLESQELKPVFIDGRFFFQYFDSLFPLAPKTYQRVLARNFGKLREVLGEESTACQEYSGIAAALGNLSEVDATSGATGDRRLQFEAVRQRLQSLVSSSAEVEGLLNTNLAELCGLPGDAASFAPLEQLLDEQFYVLSYWQNVNLEINYRRFFAINDLVGMRVQDPVVFDASHALIRHLAEQQSIGGLRIDHIDGLRDPGAYLNRLRDQLAKSEGPDSSESPPLYVEKILARGEELPPDWPVAGTTGYDFLNALNCFFIDPRGTKRIEEVYFKFLGKDLPYDDVLYQKKKLVMATLLGAEMRSLGHQLELLAEDDRYARDLSKNDLTQALIETTAHLPVYRTYIRNLDVGLADRRVIEQALHDAQARKFYLEPSMFDFLRDVLLLQNRPHLLPDQREARLGFVTRWQQFTGPIMAKAFEDTFLYVYNPLISLNEVGGDPRPSTAAASDLFAFIEGRFKHWPLSLNATTTHDTKRAEDVRARLNVLSERPEEWEAHLERWSKLNSAHKQPVNGQPVPDRNEEIFLYQTLLGAWPAGAADCQSFQERIEEYAVKATREAMVHTRWTVPNLAHEQALKRFVSAILKPAKENAFLSDFSAFQEQIAYQGMINGLSQTLLKIFSPGIPDFYQGSELWDFRLVDPDNRRPVDFAKRCAMLAKMQERPVRDSAALVAELRTNWRDGGIKLYLIWKALNFRREHAELFSQGDFVELSAECSRKENVAGFIRRYNGEWALAIVPRWLGRERYLNRPGSPEQFWEDTHVSLPASAPILWFDVFTGERVETSQKEKHPSLAVSQVLRRFPVALLTATKPAASLRGERQE